jgi:pimeloyl-ACP methyl ester carboxylesterase
MFVSEFACPCCGTVIRPANPVGVGREVQCYACRTTFVVTAPEESPSAHDVVRVKPTYSTHPGQERVSGEDQRHYRPARKYSRRKRQGPKIGLIALLITGGLGSILVLVLVGVLAYRQLQRAGLSWNQPNQAGSLTEARRGFQTKLARRQSPSEPAPEPPPDIFRLVRYDSPAGKLAAYLTPDPRDGRKHPAIIWITGGDCNSIDEGCWQEGPPSNDQSASAFRKAGIVMMFPSLRGGNDNPGVKEGFLGEVDDVLAAAEYLGKQDFVDPKRIYLGGHSTGGTLALLAAECSDRFRAVFSFGPVDNVAGYPREFLPFDTSNPREIELRSPGRWLASIKSPTFVLEGTHQGNIRALLAMARSSTNPNARFLAVRGADHFGILAPVTRLIADKILRDNGPASNIALTEEEVSRLFRN